MNLNRPMLSIVPRVSRPPVNPRARLKWHPLLAQILEPACPPVLALHLPAVPFASAPVRKEG